MSRTPRLWRPQSLYPVHGDFNTSPLMSAACFAINIDAEAARLLFNVNTTVDRKPDMCGRA